MALRDKPKTVNIQRREAAKGWGREWGEHASGGTFLIEVDMGVPGSDGTVPKGGPVERARGLGIGVAKGSSVPRGLPRTHSMCGRSGIS